MEVLGVKIERFSMLANDYLNTNHLGPLDVCRPWCADARTHLAFCRLITPAPST